MRAQVLWAELEVGAAGRQTRLDKIHSQALQTWPAAVRAAEEEVLEAKQRVTASLEAIAALCQELGLTETAEGLGLEVTLHPEQSAQGVPHDGLVSAVADTAPAAGVRQAA